MKKVLFMALVVMASATLSANAADKKKKKNKGAEVESAIATAPVVLNTRQDSLSYASGMAATQGLITYLQRNLGLDTTFMADFKKGFYDAIERGGEPTYVA